MNKWITANGVTGRAVAALPFVERVVFISYAQADFNAKDAAHAVGMGYTTFVYRLKQAKEQLKTNQQLIEYAAEILQTKEADPVCEGAADVRL